MHAVLLALSLLLEGLAQVTGLMFGDYTCVEGGELPYSRQPHSLLIPGFGNEQLSGLWLSEVRAKKEKAGSAINLQAIPKWQQMVGAAL